MEAEKVDLHNKCVLVAIYCGIYYNRKDIIINYEINNVYDLIHLLLNGTIKHKSLFDKLNDRTLEIDNLWKDELNIRNFNPSDECNSKYKKTNEYIQGTNMLEKVKDGINNGSAKFDLLLYVGMYFNIHFKEILIHQNNNENLLLNKWNDKLIEHPSSIIILHGSIKNGIGHQFYNDDVEKIEEKIRSIINIDEEFEDLVDMNMDFEFDYEELNSMLNI
jgi:hypothetical protein